MKFRQSILVVLAALILGSCVTSVSGKDLAKEYYNLGNAYFGIKKYKEAIEFYQKTLEFDEYASKASFNMAYSHIALGNADEALKILTTLLERDPRNTALFGLIAYAQHLKGDDDSAIVSYQNIIAIQPDDKDALYNLGIIYWKKKAYDKAESYFLSLVKAGTGDAQVLNSLGTMFLEEQKPKEAAGFLNQYLEVKPEDVTAYLTLAKAYTDLKQYLKALETYEKAIAVDSSQKAVWFHRADILLTKAQDPDKGVTSLEQALFLGFNNMADIITLVQNVKASPLLEHEKNKVYVLLKQKNLMPNVSPEK